MLYLLVITDGWLVGQPQLPGISTYEPLIPPPLGRDGPTIVICSTAGLISIELTMVISLDCSPIYAIGDGTVVNVSPACSSCYQWSNGNYVVVEHDNNVYSAYLHLSGFNVKEGQTVKKGQVIAYMGHSGFATGTHLHLGIYIGEPFVGGSTQSVNPLTSIYSGF